MQVRSFENHPPATRVDALAIRDLRPSQGQAPETAALRNLDDRLGACHSRTDRGWRMAERERRLRLPLLDGAELWSRETSGRGLTEGERMASSGGSADQWRTKRGAATRPVAEATAADPRRFLRLTLGAIGRNLAPSAPRGIS